MSEETGDQPRQGIRLAVLLPVIGFFALSAIFLAQLLSGRDSQELTSVLVGREAPTFSLPPLAGLKSDGEPVPGLSSTDLKGGLHLVNIWASWCVPCRAEHPVLMSLSRDERLKVVGINYKDDPGNALRFLGALGNPFARVGTDEAGRAALEWGFYGIPETFLVDADGVVRHKVIGPLTQEKYDELLAAVEKVSPK